MDETYLPPQNRTPPKITTIRGNRVHIVAVCYLCRFPQKQMLEIGLAVSWRARNLILWSSPWVMCVNHPINPHRCIMVFQRCRAAQISLITSLNSQLDQNSQQFGVSTRQIVPLQYVARFQHNIIFAFFVSCCYWPSKFGVPDLQNNQVVIKY